MADANVFKVRVRLLSGIELAGLPVRSGNIVLVAEGCGVISSSPLPVEDWGTICNLASTAEGCVSMTVVLEPTAFETPQTDAIERAALCPLGVDVRFRLLTSAQTGETESGKGSRLKAVDTHFLPVGGRWVSQQIAT